MNYFHERAKKALKRAKMSQCKLAKTLGVSQASVWEWLNISYPSLDRFYQICSVLKVTPNYLLGVEDSQKD